MKKTLIIVGIVAIIMMLLIARLFLKQKNGMEDERLWFVKSLQYEFTGKVDAITVFNDQSGRIRCLLLDGDPRIYREDSLKKLFVQHDMLYLIFKRSSDTLTFILPNHIKEVEIGDSLRVSSQDNSIQFFRDGEIILTDSLTSTLTGFSRPFFLKGDR